jgi:hypothetical protein
LFFWDEKTSQLGFQVELNGFNAVQPRITHFEIDEFKKKNNRLWQKQIQQSKRQYEKKIRMGKDVRTLKGVKRILEGSMNKNIDICLEIEDLRVFLIATCDCRLGLVDAFNFRILMKVQLDIKRIQHILFSGSHQTIILINHSNNIPLFLLSLKDDEFEIEFVSNLIGHLSILVTAVLIKTRGFLISVDESNVVKVWNLTLRRCVQTLELATKFPVSSVYFQNQLFRLSFISKKINQFELTVINDEKTDSVEDLLLDFHFDPLSKRIYVFKSSCSYTINSENGRIINIKHYLPSKEDSSEIQKQISKEIEKKEDSLASLPSVNFSSILGAHTPKELNKKVKQLNKETLKEQQQRRKVKNRVNNMMYKNLINSKNTLSTTSLTPRFAPNKSKIKDIDTGLNDIYSWANNASCIKVINHGHHLAMGKFSGKAKIESLQKRESKPLVCHSSKIIGLHYDFQHHLCLSVSSSLLQIQQESSQGYKSLRKLRLKNFPQEPSLVKLSVSLNMIIFVSSFNQIFIVDYEFLRMFARVYMPCIKIASPRSNDQSYNVCSLNPK